MKRNIYIFVCCLLSTVFCFAQSPKIDSLLNILKTAKDDTTKVNVYNNLFLEYEFTDDKKVLENLNKAVELSQKNDFKTGLGIAYLYFGYFAEDKGLYQEALKNYFTSLKIFETIGNKKRIASSYNNIGLVYYYQGNFPAALKNYFSSLKKSSIEGYKKEEANSYNNIGLVYYTQGNYPDALKNHLASLKIREEIAEKKGIAGSCNNIGNIYNAQGNYPEALKNYLAALKINEENGNKDWAAINYNNIGNVYKSQGKYPEALKNYLASITIKKALGEKSGIAGAYLNAGDVFIKQKKYNDAEDFLLKAKDLSKEIGFKEILRDTYSELAELDSAKSNFKGAYENHKLYILYRDSLDNEETRKKTIQSQMTYDFEKKEAVATAEHKKELESQKVLTDEKSRKQRVVLFFVLGSLLLVLFFAGFIFRSLRITRKQKNIIEEQKNLVEQQKREVEEQKNLVEEHQKEIIDSITYARRIQRSLLPTDKYIYNSLKRLKKS